MNVFLNGEKIDMDLQWPLNWGTFFQKLIQGCRFFPKDHGIVKLEVDGTDSLFLISDGADLPVAEDIKKIDIYTADSLSIVRLGFERAAALIDGIVQETNDTVTLYRDGKMEEGSGRVVKIMEALKSIVTFIQGVGFNYRVDFEKTKFDKTRSLRERLDGISQTFMDMSELQKTKDISPLADLLAGRFTQDLADWKKLINTLLKAVEAQRKPE